MNSLKEIALGTAIGRPVFRHFSVTQTADNAYAVRISYSLQTVVGESVIAETSVVDEVLTGSQVTGHPLFPSLYPMIQGFTRAVLSEKRPDLVSP